MRPTLLGTHFAARLTIMYKFLCPFLLIILFVNGIKSIFITLYSNSVRRYGGDLFSGRLCLPIKLQKLVECFLSISSEFNGYSGAGKKLSLPITF